MIILYHFCLAFIKISHDCGQYYLLGVNSDVLTLNNKKKKM